MVQFSRNAPGIKSGSMWTVDYVSGNTVILSGPTGRIVLPLDKTDRFTLYRKSEIALAVGDTIAITKNTFDRDGRRLSNGQILNVLSLDDENGITFINPASKTTCRLGREFGHIRYGYTSTSHSSQGRTVDEVFISQGSFTHPAGSREQFYVSVSRARDMVHIYTDSKTALLEQVTESGHRQSALELVGPDGFGPPIAGRLANIQPPPQPSKPVTNQTPSHRPVKTHAPKPAY